MQTDFSRAHETVLARSVTGRCREGHLHGHRCILLDRSRTSLGGVLTLEARRRHLNPAPSEHKRSTLVQRLDDLFVYHVAPSSKASFYPAYGLECLSS